MITAKIRLNRTYTRIEDGRPDLPAGEYTAYIGEPRVLDANGNPNGHYKVVYQGHEYSLDNVDFDVLSDERAAA